MNPPVESVIMVFLILFIQVSVSIHLSVAAVRHVRFNIVRTSDDVMYILGICLRGSRRVLTDVKIIQTNESWFLCISINTVRACSSLLCLITQWIPVSHILEWWSRLCLWYYHFHFRPFMSRLPGNIAAEAWLKGGPNDIHATAWLLRSSRHSRLAL